PASTEHHLRVDPSTGLLVPNFASGASDYYETGGAGLQWHIHYHQHPSHVPGLDPGSSILQPTASWMPLRSPWPTTSTGTQLSWTLDPRTGLYVPNYSTGNSAGHTRHPTRRLQPGTRDPNTGLLIPDF